MNAMRNRGASMDDSSNDERKVLIQKFQSFNDILPHVGEFGRYQVLLLLALFPYGLAYGSLYFAQYFFTIVPKEHWCKVDELMHLTQEDRISIAIPKDPSYPGYDVCRRKDLNYTKLLAEGHGKDSSIWNTNETVGCTTWEYNFTEIPYASIAAELDWVCDRAYLISSVQSIFFCGSILGGFLFGWIADRRGRVPALVLCNIVGFVASIATAHTNSFWSFALCRFLTGMAFDNCINIPLIVVMEYVAVNRRTLVFNFTFGVYFAVGTTLLPWIAYYMADWRYFTYATSFPLLCAIMTPWILPESARWYMSQGMTSKVIEKVQRIAKINRKNPNPIIYEKFAENLRKVVNQAETATMVDLFKYPRMTRIATLLIMMWTFEVLTFDGHVYSLKLLQHSVFVSFSLACATELPAGLLLTLLLDRWGRRFCGFITMALTGVCSLMELFLPPGAGRLTMSIVCRFCLNMAANVGLQCAAELLPTPVRAQGVSLIHIFGIVAHTVAPYIVDMASLWDGLPMLTLGIFSFVTAILVLFLPETQGQDLPQTLEEGENFGKDQKFWTIPFCRRNWNA